MPKKKVAPITGFALAWGRKAVVTCRVPVEQAPRRYEASDLPYSAAALIRPPKSAVLQHLK